MQTAKSLTEVAGAREKTEFATGHARKSHSQGSSSQTVPPSKTCPIQILKAKTRSIVCRRQESDIVYNKVGKRRWKAEKGQKVVFFEGSWPRRPRRYPNYFFTDC